MLRFPIGVVLTFALATSAAAADMRCPDWQRLTRDQKSVAVAQMIESHTNSQRSRQFTSENRIAMQRCLEGFTERIIDDIDETCSDSHRSGRDAVDDTFDRYLLSCVQ